MGMSQVKMRKKSIPDKAVSYSGLIISGLIGRAEIFSVQVHLGKHAFRGKNKSLYSYDSYDSYDSYIRMRRELRIKGLTLMELLIGISVLGTVLAMSSAIIANVHHNASGVKLDSDVKNLNRSVKAYQASGGAIAGVSDEAEAIAKLKTVAASDLAHRIPGFSSSMIDPRIQGVMQSFEESLTDQPRVVWDIVDRKFVIRREGRAGFKAFVNNVDQVEPVPIEESREASFLYSKEGSWIWDFQDREVTKSAAATLIPVGFVSSSPQPEPTSTGPQALEPPVFSPQPGSFPAADFDLHVSIYDPNSSGKSNIFYSLDYSEWLPMPGDTVLVGPNQILQAQAVTSNSEKWSSSTVREGLYAGLPATTFAGFTDATVSGVTATDGGSGKYKIKSNNGHGNNYDGVDGSNPATLKQLLESSDSPDDEINVKMPKNSTFIESGDPVHSLILPKGILITGSEFAFASPGGAFSLGTFQYFNGATKEGTALSGFPLAIPITFEQPEAKTVYLEIAVKIDTSASDSDTISLSLPNGKSKWIEVTLSGIAYEIRPAFTGAKGGKASISVSSGQTGVVRMEAALVPVVTQAPVP